jgi:biotin synthase-like enzyme
MCPVRGKTTSKDKKGERNRTMNSTYTKEHQQFRTYAVSVGEFERNAMKEMAANGTAFYNTETFKADFKKVSNFEKFSYN